MTKPKSENPLLETLIFEGVDAFVTKSREDRLAQGLAEVQQWARDNAEEIDSAIRRFEAEEAEETSEVRTDE